MAIDIQFSSVQLLSCIKLFVTAARQASLSSANSQRLSKLIHWVGDAIQPSHPLSSPPLVLNLSKHQGLFKWVSSSHQVAKVLEWGAIAFSGLSHRVRQVMKIKNAHSSVHFSCSDVSDSLWLCEPQHTRPPCPSPTPGVHPNPCSLCRWSHPIVSSSVVPFSSCLQSFPASGSFQMSQLLASGG